LASEFGKLLVEVDSQGLQRFLCGAVRGDFLRCRSRGRRLVNPAGQSAYWCARRDEGRIEVGIEQVRDFRQIRVKFNQGSAIHATNGAAGATFVESQLGIEGFECRDVDVEGVG
jgi:hypothetical protein